LATLICRNGRFTVAAVEADETELLQHARQQGGRLALDDGYYDIRKDRIILPDNLGEGPADRIRRAFEAAAKRHHEALKHRGRFRVLPSGQGN